MLATRTLNLKPNVRLKMDYCETLILSCNYRTTSVLPKKKKAEIDRFEIFKNKFVFPEDQNKRPSDLEIKQKDLPKNQPTLKQRIERDEHHQFFQRTPKHGYYESERSQITLIEEMKVALKTRPKDAIISSFQVVKDEVKKFNQEVKDGEYSAMKQAQEQIGVLPGDRRKEWGFQSEVEMDEWILTKDSDWGEGYSSAEFKLNSAGTAGVLSGDLSTRIPNDGRTDEAGYVNISSVNKRRSFGRLKLLHHWASFTHLTMNVRGDGRKYLINLKCKQEYDITWDDRWHYPLYTRGGPYWQYVKIPFSKFILGHKGSIQDRQEVMDKQQLFYIQSISFTLKDKITGPYRLEIKDVSLHNDPFGDDEVFAYEMYKVPAFWIGMGGQ